MELSFSEAWPLLLGDSWEMSHFFGNIVTCFFCATKTRKQTPFHTWQCLPLKNPVAPQIERYRTACRPEFSFNTHTTSPVLCGNMFNIVFTWLAGGNAIKCLTKSPNGVVLSGTEVEFGSCKPKWTCFSWWGFTTLPFAGVLSVLFLCHPVVVSGCRERETH